MTSKTMYLLKRELPGLLPRLVVIVGLPILVFAVVAIWPDRKVEKPKPKRDTYKFDLCSEASLRDGNGMLATADKCGKYLDR